ncbi:MAG: hypothetical protein EOO72_13130, partial [Myxococcaceae bacterium]
VMFLALPVLAAEAQRTGTWGAYVKEQQLQLSLQPKDRPDSHHGFFAPLTDFQGLSTAEGSSAPFKLVREAGTFDFEGRFKDGQGVGTWRFSPDAGFAKKLAELGIPRPDADEQFLLASVNVGPRRVQALAAVGQKVTTVEELVQVGIFRVTPEYVRAMAAEGYPKLTLEQLVSCRIHGVTPAFVKEMRDAGYENATADDFISLRIHGIDSVFVRSMSKKRK